MIWLACRRWIVVGIPAASGLDRTAPVLSPAGAVDVAPAAHAAPLAMRGGDGTELPRLDRAPATTPAPAVIYFGGNGEEVSWMLADSRWPREVT
jgi:hypothetical protein